MGVLRVKRGSSRGEKYLYYSIVELKGYKRGPKYAETCIKLNYHPGSELAAATQLDNVMLMSCCMKTV